jgi:diadenosine tetraphosphate (Ap4A) HIT family hydrolase
MKPVKCPFCDFRGEAMRQRVFYRDENWYAILAAPRHNEGHSLLIALPKNPHCPTRPSEDTLTGLPKALSNVTEAIKAAYRPKDVLLASLRGSEGHFHFHLVPLYEKAENAWRSSHQGNEGYGKGHLMEFLGHLEKQGDERAATQRRENGLSEEQQRTKIVASQKPEIEELRLAAAGYYHR